MKDPFNIIAHYSVDVNEIAGNQCKGLVSRMLPASGSMTAGMVSKPPQPCTGRRMQINFYKTLTTFNSIKSHKSYINWKIGKNLNIINNYKA